jgi:hypothetical protein
MAWADGRALPPSPRSSPLKLRPQITDLALLPVAMARVLGWPAAAGSMVWLAQAGSPGSSNMSTPRWTPSNSTSSRGVAGQGWERSSLEPGQCAVRRASPSRLRPCRERMPMAELDSVAAAVSPYVTAAFGLAGSLIGGTIAGTVSLVVARQARDAAEHSWIRDNRREIYDRFLGRQRTSTRSAGPSLRTSTKNAPSATTSVSSRPSATRSPRGPPPRSPVPGTPL